MGKLWVDFKLKKIFWAEATRKTGKISWNLTIHPSIHPSNFYKKQSSYISAGAVRMQASKGGGHPCFTCYGNCYCRVQLQIQSNLPSTNTHTPLNKLQLLISLGGGRRKSKYLERTHAVTVSSWQLHTVGPSGWNRTGDLLPARWQWELNTAAVRTLCQSIFLREFCSHFSCTRPQ